MMKFSNEAEAVGGAIAAASTPTAAGHPRPEDERQNSEDSSLRSPITTCGFDQFSKCINRAGPDVSKDYAEGA